MKTVNKKDIAAFEKTANTWIAVQTISIKHDEIDIDYCERKRKLINEEIELSKKGIILAEENINCYVKSIKNGEYGEEYKNIKF